jgi:hypothetical protein
MDLKRDKRQNIQEKLDFSSEQTGEACQAGREETESRQAVHEPESPASTIRLMEEVCERENLLEASRRVKANKGSAGIDGMTVGQLSGYLKERERSKGRVACNCLIDEGRPLGTGLQGQVSNHLRRLWSKVMVVSTEGKGLARTRSGDRQEEDRKGTTMEVSKA